MASYIAFRQVLPSAQLSATMINAQGGYQRKKAGSKVSDSIPAEATEFLPSYARYRPALELMEPANPLKAVDPAALRELWEGRETLSPLLFMAVNWDGVRSLVGEG